MTRTRIGATAALAVGLLLTACGGGGSGGGDNGEAAKSADQIVKDATAALKAARSFHITVNADASTLGGSSGSSGFSGPVTVDLDVAEPNSATGTLKMAGVVAHIVYTGGKFYLQGKELWSKFGGAQAGELIGDRWVLVPASASGFSSLTDINQITDCLLPATGNTKNGTSVVGGQTTVVVENKASAETLYVASQGAAYPLKVVSKGGGSSSSSSSSSGCGSNDTAGNATFSNFGTTVTVTPPPNALDISKLGG